MWVVGENHKYYFEVKVANHLISFTAFVLSVTTGGVVPIVMTATAMVIQAIAEAHKASKIDPKGAGAGAGAFGFFIVKAGVLTFLNVLTAGGGASVERVLASQVTGFFALCEWLIGKWLLIDEAITGAQHLRDGVVLEVPAHLQREAEKAAAQSPGRFRRFAEGAGAKAQHYFMCGLDHPGEGA